MRDHILRWTARPSFITSLSFLAIPGVCRPVCQSNSFNVSRCRIAKSPSAGGAIEKSFLERADLADESLIASFDVEQGPFANLIKAFL
jgi:hypothetical protein